MFKPLGGSVKGLKGAIIILRQSQDYRPAIFVMSLSNPERLMLKHPPRPGIFTRPVTFASSLLLVQSRLPVPFGQRLALAVHDER